MIVSGHGQPDSNEVLTAADAGAEAAAIPQNPGGIVLIIRKLLTLRV